MVLKVLLSGDFCDSASDSSFSNDVNDLMEQWFSAAEQPVADLQLEISRAFWRDRAGRLRRGPGTDRAYAECGCDAAVRPTRHQRAGRAKRRGSGAGLRFGGKRYGQYPCGC